MADAMHVFEKAGLGKAPFTFIGAERRVGPLPILDAQGRPTGGMVGSPGQPMGTCRYCGQGIAICCLIRSADGRTFIVGSDCVNLTGDAGLKRRVNIAIRNQVKDEEIKRIEVVAERVKSNVKTRARLAALPSPNEYRARFNETALDWATWMLAYAGKTGKMRVVRFVAKTEARP